MAITAKIDGNKLIISADLETPTPSASGKTMVVCSSRGNIALPVQVDGHALVMGLNVYYKR